jgi:hypothetical protein
MREPKQLHIPPYIRPVYYQYRYEDKRRTEATKRAPSEWRNLAIFQGLVAIGFVALGRASIQNGWPFWLMVSMGSAQEALKRHTIAMSNYLTLRKQRLQK